MVADGKGSVALKDVIADRLTVSPAEGKDEGGEEGKELQQMKSTLKTQDQTIKELKQQLAAKPSLTAEEVSDLIRKSAKESKVDYNDVTDYNDFAEKFSSDLETKISDKVKASKTDQENALAIERHKMKLEANIERRYDEEFAELKEFNKDAHTSFKPIIEDVRRQLPGLAEFLGPLDIHSILVGREVIDEWRKGKRTPKSGVKPKKHDTADSASTVDRKKNSLDAAVSSGTAKARENKHEET